MGAQPGRPTMELALESGRPSGEHVQNVLSRLKGSGDAIRIETPISLKEEPKANTHRYDHLRTEVSHVR